MSCHGEAGLALLQSETKGDPWKESSAKAQIIQPFVCESLLLSGIFWRRLEPDLRNLKAWPCSLSCKQMGHSHICSSC